MSTIVLILPVSQVVVSQGRAVATASVTNTATVPARIVLGAFPLAGPEAGERRPAAAAWTTVDRPLREISAGATEQFGVAFAPPAEVGAGTYPVRFIAYSADGAPEENSDQSRQVDVIIPAVAASPAARAKPPWWLYAVAAGLVVIVGIVGFLVLRGGGEAKASPSPTPSVTTPSAPPVVVEGITWTLTGFQDGSSTTPIVPGTKITLRVEGDRVSGSAGCNSYSAEWVRNDNEVKIGTAGTTLILCTQAAVREQERRFLDTLQKVRVITSGTTPMELLTPDGTGLVFEK